MLMFIAVRYFFFLLFFFKGWASELVACEPVLVGHEIHHAVEQSCPETSQLHERSFPCADVGVEASDHFACKHGAQHKGED